MENETYPVCLMTRTTETMLARFSNGDDAERFAVEVRHLLDSMTRHDAGDILFVKSIDVKREGDSRGEYRDGAPKGTHIVRTMLSYPCKVEDYE